MAYEENKNSSINMDIAVVVKVKKGYAIKTAADILMGKREAGGVFIGKDNYLIDTFSEYDKKIFNKNIKNIVLCVGHYCFFSDLSLAKTPSELQRISKVYYPLLHDSHNCLILPPKDEYYMQGNLIDLEKVITTYATADYKDGFFNEKRPRNRCATVVWNAVSKSWSELSAEEKDKAGKTRAESHNKIIKHTASFNENLSVFQDFVYFCNDRGINLLLTAMPASSQYLKYLTPEYKNIFYSVLDKVDGTVHLLDLVEDSSFDNNFDFNDTDHLSDSGARKLSQMISSILNQINN